MGSLPTRTSLKLRIFLQQQITVFPAIPPVVYLEGILYQLDERQIWALSVIWIPPLVAILAVAAPLWGIHRLIDRALREAAGPPGERLRRILRLPRQFELWVSGSYSVGVAIFTLAACATYHRPFILVVPAVLVALAMILLMMVRQTVKVEEVLRPAALEEMQRDPSARPRGSGLLWPRQVWYLPYVTSIVVLATFVALAVIASRRTQQFLASWTAELERRGQVQLASEVPVKASQLLSSLVLPSAIILGWVLVLGIITSLTVARRQRAGSRAVERAVLGLATGAPELPAFPATDELGDLAFATAAAMAGLEEKATAIGASARTVDEVSRELSALVARQLQVVDSQSGAIQRTWTTAQEIQQTAELTSQKARAVLSAAELAAQAGASGREAVDKSLQQLSDIREHVSEMSGQVEGLQQRARAIGRITMVVKDLADQSSTVALNAAIEATRAGQAGRTFAVVAQQIRRLSDESTAATEQVHGVLVNVEASIRETVRLSGAGMEQADAGLALARTYGDHLRKLTSVVEENAASARQISAAVDQQAAGIAMIFDTITSLSATMDQTVEAMKITATITARAQQAADSVAEAMAGYRWRPGEPGPPITP